MQGGGDVIFCLSAYRGDLYPLSSFLFLLLFLVGVISKLGFFLFVTDCVTPTVTLVN